MSARKSLYLIRHSNPKIDPTIAAAQWGLSPAGKEQAQRLAEYLRYRGIQKLFSSSERKAIQTAQALGQTLALEINIEQGLHEHERPLTTPYLGPHDFDEQMRQLFARPSELIFGSETADQAYERFNAAMLRLIAENPDKTLAVVSHGTVLSLFIARHCTIDAYTFWKSLGLPASIQMSLQNFQLTETWTPPTNS